MHGELIAEAPWQPLDLDGAAEMSPYWCYSAGDIKASQIQRLPFVSDPLPLCAWGGHWSSEFMFWLLMVALLSAQDSGPASVTALNISNWPLVSSMSLKRKSKYRVVLLSSFLLLKTQLRLCVHIYVIEGIFNAPGQKFVLWMISFSPEALIIDLRTLQQG